jgi:hypothetical protein
LTASERVFDTGGMGRDGAASALADLAARVQPTMLAREQCLPVLPALEPLLPGADLRRGATVSVDGPAATSLALAAAAGPSQDGAWVAAVGFPSLGLLAAAELGVALDRLVLVADPGGDGEDAAWPAVVAALVDAFEVVLVHAQHRVGAADGRRLAARARERGAVLVQVGASRSTSATWPEGADVSLTVVDAAWEGLGEGHGHLRARRVTVEGGGRRDASRPRRAELWLPSADGAVDAVLPAPVPLRATPREAETA